MADQKLHKSIVRSHWFRASCRRLTLSLSLLLWFVLLTPPSTSRGSTLLRRCPALFKRDTNTTETDHILHQLQFSEGRTRQKREEYIRDLIVQGFSPVRRWVHPRPLLKAFKDLKDVRSIFLTVEEFRRGNMMRTVLSLMIANRKTLSGSPHLHIEPLTTFLSDDRARFPRPTLEQIATMEHYPTHLVGNVNREPDPATLQRILKTKFRLNIPYIPGSNMLTYENPEFIRVESRVENRRMIEKYWVTATYKDKRDEVIIKPTLVAVIEIETSPSMQGGDLIEIHEPLILNVFNSIDLFPILTGPETSVQ